MKTKTKYRIFAVLICIVIYFIYIVIATGLGWKHGGGILVLVMLLGIISWIWKRASEMGKKADLRKTNKNGEVVEQVDGLKTDEMSIIEIQSIQEQPSNESPMDKPTDVEPSHLPVSNMVVDEPPKIQEVMYEEPQNNSSVNLNKKNRSKWLIILICIIFTILLSGIIVYLFVIIPNIKRKKAIEELYIKGLDAYDRGLYELAIKNYYEAVKLDSTSWGLKYMLGNCYYRQDSYYSAYFWYDKAYELNPEHNDVVVANDTLHYKSYLGRYTFSSIKEHPLAEKSLQLAQEFYSLYPNDVKAYRLMIMAYVHYAQELDFDKKKQKKYQNMSLQWGNKMIEKFPNKDDSYFCLAYTQSQMGDDRAAIDNYKKCIELNPSNKTAYNNLGCCYEDINNYSEAYKCWRKAIQLGEKDFAPSNLKRHRQPL